MFTQLKGIFAPQAVAQYLKALPPIKTSIMDSCFPGRTQKPFAMVGISDLLDIVGTVPVIRRGGMSTPVSAGSVNIEMIEPLPVKPSKDITGQDLNNLRMILGDKASIDTWARDVTEHLRNTCRLTTEGIAATALTGTITWPVRLDGGGWENYVVAFGSTLSVTPGVLFDAEAAKVTDVYNVLSDMETEIQDGGYGGNIEYLAGKSAYIAILSLVENFKSTAKMRVVMEDGVIDVGGYKIRKMSERYKNPQTGTMVPKVADNKICAYATDAPASVIYCALDDIDAKLQPYPFFPKPTALPEGNGYRIIGQSKPLPVRSPKSICWATVTA